MNTMQVTSTAGMRVGAIVLIGALGTSFSGGSLAQTHGMAVLPEVKPDTVGFSPERLGRLDAFMQRMVDEKEFAGIVTMSARQASASTFLAGLGGTWFWIDPNDDLVFVGMVQRFGPVPVRALELSQQTTYQALLDSNK
jgi:CubicO group peptidase (beta-lactamase class C family)